MTLHTVPALPHVPAHRDKYILTHVKVTESETSFLTRDIINRDLTSTDVALTLIVIVTTRT